MLTQEEEDVQQAAAAAAPTKELNVRADLYDDSYSPEE